MGLEMKGGTGCDIEMRGYIRNTSITVQINCILTASKTISVLQL